MLWYDIRTLKTLLSFKQRKECWIGILALFTNNNNTIDSLTQIIVNYNVDSLFEFHIAKFQSLGYETPSAQISIAFTPFPGVGFGGCDNDQFILELNNPDFEIIYSLEKGLPHEIYHFINEENLNKQDSYTALDLAINEGLACHFTREYFEGDISKYEAVENMSVDDWQYYEKNEKEIFTVMEEYFIDTSGSNPLLQTKKFGLFLDASRINLLLVRL